ncbi:hypothetical protein RCL_jg22443.t1 [Rhizophagus clarus]|uniref:Uncharacterized protein n=1 Tax=Rhizophagus clarus TaxID=94130 RepID=A0A8H3R483_9GLOM|nr:hypothetical protein RCL_jg22443.t1 [Rhizophagus clarus]
MNKEITHIKANLESILMQSQRFLSKYFTENDFNKDDNVFNEETHIIVQVLSATVKSLQMFYLSNKKFAIYTVSKTTEKVMREMESHWEQLKDKLVRKIELGTFRTTNHIYAKKINASGILVIDERPSFILHSLPTFQTIMPMKATSMKKCSLRYLIMLRKILVLDLENHSLYELLCRKFRIYLSLSAGNGSKNLESNTAIEELKQYLPVNNPEENAHYAFKFTHVILLDRLFILNELLDFHN